MYEKKCTICHKTFKAKVEHKITCSIECRKIHQKQISVNHYYKNKEKFNGKCLFCSNEIVNLSGQARYCSNICKNKAKYDRAEFHKICKSCGKEFVTKENRSEHCSSKCFFSKSEMHQKHDDVELICVQCNNKFIAPYADRSRIVCSFSCRTNYNNSKRDIAEVGKKISKAQKFRFENGAIHPWIGRKHSQETKNKISKNHLENELNKGSKNPMFGKTHSKEIREKISEKITKSFLEGKIPFYKGGKYFSTKLNKEIYYRSLWEKQYFIYLDNDITVLTFVPEPFSIDYIFDNKRRYIPDLFVVYKSGEQKIVEIKPSCFLEAKINQAKFSAARNYCKQKGFLFEVWTEKSNPYINTI